MKIKFTLLAVFLMSLSTGFAQQVPNASFENWTNSYTCTGWTGVEALISDIFPVQGSIFTFKDTINFTDGLASIKLVADTVPGAPAQIGVIPGVASLGTGALAGTTPSFTGIPFIYRPDSVIFDYMFSTPGADTAAASLKLSHKGTQLLGYMGASNGVQTYLPVTNGWVHMALAIDQYYISNDYPDSVLVQFVSSINKTLGSTLNIDNVKFGYVNQPLAVTVSGNTTFCSATSASPVTLQAHTGTSTSYTYQWNLEGSAISGATNSSYTASDTGTYTVVIDSATTSIASEPIVITIDNVVATLGGLNDTFCSNANAIALQGGNPAGGVYSGSGVSSSNFYPSSALGGLDTITYVVTDQNGCAKSAAATVFVETCTGINTIATNNLSVYPNPASTVLTISSNTNLAGLNLQVFDLLGRVVISQVLEGSANTINVSKLISGAYIYRITDAANNVVSQDKFAVIK